MMFQHACEDKLEPVILISMGTRYPNIASHSVSRDFLMILTSAFLLDVYSFGDIIGYARTSLGSLTGCWDYAEITPSSLTRWLDRRA